MIPDSRFSRRGVLLALASAPFAVACTTTPPPPPPPDPLAALAAQARADAALATVLGATEVAANRGEHAKRLQAEVDRERPPVSSSAAPTSSAPAPTGDLATLRAALSDAVRKASDLVPTLPTYRVGLVGSVAAGCASLVEVLG